jgi:hypothetical protein
MPSSRPKVVLISLALLAFGIVVGLGTGLWLLLLETGEYPTSHGLRIDGKAYRALQEAGQLQPGTHLVVGTKRAFVGPDTYWQLRLSKTFDTNDRATLHTRCITFEVEKGLLHESVLRPIITHRGNKPTEGFAVWMTGRQPSGLDH